MPFGGPDSERALILLRRRDAQVASNLLTEATFTVNLCTDAFQLFTELERGAGFAVLSEEVASEMVAGEGVEKWVAAQPAWSDFPIIMVTARTDVPSRNRAAVTLQEKFGNVSFLERPFHPTTLISLARSASRSRRRQYEARALLARYELLARELQHRTKNLLSVILSIASASLRKGGDGSEALVDRLHSLAKAQDLIFEEGGSGALLEHVVRSIVESFGARISIEGPPVYLKAGVAQGFALIVHELATNAVKYGALTAESGHVSVRWSLNAGVEEPTVSFTWEELGGPPAAPPEHRGFGTILLEKAVASSGDPPRFNYGPSGFTYQITALCR
jgi:two-component sensor histidine kinase